MESYVQICYCVVVKLPTQAYVFQIFISGRYGARAIRQIQKWVLPTQRDRY